MTGQAGARCAHWIGAEQRYCGATDGVRHYLPGLACPAHTPSALRGRPEPLPGPGRPADWPTPAPLRTPQPRDRRPLTAVKTT